MIYNIDRRIIYLFVAFALSLPLVLKTTLPPAPMPTATAFYQEIEKIPEHDKRIVLVALDWGPNTQGENRPQTLGAIEHLMRKRIPFAVITIYALAAPFLDEIPREVAAKLQAETGETWEYGKDWVNWGFKPNAMVMIQGIAKSKDIASDLKADAYSTPLESIPVMNAVKTIHDISLLIEITGLSGALSGWIQFFQGADYRPPFLHACTSISIPEAFIYYSSKQLMGMFEGLAGAAWYDKLLSDAYPKREVGRALLINTSLAYAHLLIIGLIVLGNIGLLVSVIKKRRNR
jgi:hypothetical protein